MSEGVQAMKVVASFCGAGMAWTEPLIFEIDRIEGESRKAFSIRQGDTARQAFTFLAGVTPNSVIVTEETFSL